MEFCPGKLYRGAESPGETTPVYVDNGLRVFVITCLGLQAMMNKEVSGVLTGMLTNREVSGVLTGQDVNDAPVPLLDSLFVYRHLGNYFAALNVIGLVFCLFLFVRGCFWERDSLDVRLKILLKQHGTDVDDRPLPDPLSLPGFIDLFYTGTENYPRVQLREKFRELQPEKTSESSGEASTVSGDAGGKTREESGVIRKPLEWNIKWWTNCRMGLLMWPVLLLIYVDAHRQLNRMEGGGKSGEIST
jgi:hypothetical protein